MTRKDYVLIAGAIASMDAEFSPEQVARMAERMGNALTRTNPLFDRDRFIAAATGKPQTRRDVAA